MDAVELQKKIAEGDAILLLDVREPEEARAEPFVFSQLVQVVNVPLDILMMLPKEELRERLFGSTGLPETTPLIALCRSGRRSAIASERLKSFGWDAENLEGGLIMWQKQK